MGGLGHSKVTSTWGIPSPSYIKSLGSYTTTIQRTITLSDAYYKATEWFLHHMNNLVLFRRYSWNLNTLELNVFITFSLFITIGEACMLKSEASLLSKNNAIK
jgi:hypothetical protein